MMFNTRVMFNTRRWNLCHHFHFGNNNVIYKFVITSTKEYIHKQIHTHIYTKYLLPRLGNTINVISHR